MMRSSRRLISPSSQKNDCRSCTHSKYETVTPPALARMSGTTMMPRCSRMRSASGVVGPLAPSMITEAWIRPALRAGIWFSSAAGTGRVVANPAQVGDGADHEAAFGHELGADAADVAEALHRDRRRRRIALQAL